MRKPWSRCAAVVMVMLAGAAAGVPVEEQGAQPPARERGAPDRRPGAEDRPAMDADAMRARLERRLRETEDGAARLRDAIARLDKGEPPAEVMRSLGPAPMRERRDAEAPAAEHRDGPFGGPGAQRPGMGPEDRPPRGNPEEERAWMMGFLREHLPEFADRAELWRQVDPAGADRALLRLLPRVREVAAARARDPELFRLRVEELRGGLTVLEKMRALRDARRSSEGEARDQRVARAENELREALQDQFDQRMAAGEQEIKLLERRLETMKSDMERRRADRDRAVTTLFDRIRDERGPKGENEPDGR